VAMLRHARRRFTTGGWLGVTALLLMPSYARASIITFDNAADFFAAVGPPTRFPVSSVPSVPGFSGLPFGIDGSFPFQFNSASFELDYVSGFAPLTIGDFSPRYSGNELAIKGQEDLLAITFGRCIGDEECLPTPTFFSFGFNFVEPEHDIGAAPSPDSGAFFVDSIYEVSLMNEPGELIGSLTFNAPNDTASFVGVRSTDAIRSVRIREITNDAGDEFFGDFFVADPAPVPEPSTIVYLTAGLSSLGWRRLCSSRRAKRRS
jgi:hypothetical protein